MKSAGFRISAFGRIMIVDGLKNNSRSLATAQLSGLEFNCCITCLQVFNVVLLVDTVQQSLRNS